MDCNNSFIDDDNKITLKRFKNEIDYQLKTIELKKLQSIANLIGLLSNNSNKEILYKNIETHLMNLELIEHSKIIFEPNSFNKQKPELLIKDNIEALELLFWKVFRNKLIYLQIYSNFKNKNRYGYYDLKCTHEFLKNYSNSMNILIDNIKSNNYNQIINTSSHIKIIISNLSKDNQETKSFYNLLFQRYSTTKTVPQLLSTSSYINLDKNINKWVEIMINSSNLVAFQEYIKYFNMNKNEIKLLINSKLAKGYFKDYYVIKNKDLKCLNYLIENEFIQLSSIKKYVSKFNFIKDPKFKTLEIKLKSLFKKYKLLLPIYQIFDGCIFNIQDRNKFNKLILKLNEIGDINQYFTNKELNLTIIEFLEKETKQEDQELEIQQKEILYKYCKSIFLYDNLNLYTKNDNQIPFEFYFKDKEYIYSEIKYLKLMEPGIFGCFNLLFKITFKNSQNDRLELISKFIEHDNLLNLLYEEKVSIFKNCATTILSSCDIKIIDFFINKLLTKSTFHEIEESSIDNFLTFNVGLIKTKELLDYLFKNYRNSVLFSNEFIEYLGYKEIGIKDFEPSILEHYELLIQSNNSKIRIFPNQWDIQVIKRFILNPSVYILHFSPNQLFEILSNSIISNQQLFHFTISNTKLIKNEIFNIDRIFRNDELLESNSILKLFFKNVTKESILIKIQDLKDFDKDYLNFKTTIIEDNENSINFKCSFTYLFLCLYNLDRSNDILFIFDSISSNNSKLMKYILNSNLYKKLSSFNLELFINYFILKLNDINFKFSINHLYKCLCIASLNGYTSIFKKLILSKNYELIFKSTLFNSNLLIQLVKSSYNLELINLLLKFINFSLNDLNLLKLWIIENGINEF